MSNHDLRGSIHPRCEDAPCCGHNDSICGHTLGMEPIEDSDDGGAYYCDMCGYIHPPNYDCNGVDWASGENEDEELTAD